MNDKQWALLAEWMQLTLALLQKIEKNTKPETIEEPKSTITGFTAGDK